MPYSIVVSDANTGEDFILCFTATRKDGVGVAHDLTEGHPNLRVAIVADEEPEQASERGG